MPKQTTLLILVLAIVTGILVFLALKNQTFKPSPKTQVLAPTQKPVEKTARVFFSPANVDLSNLSASSNSTVDIMVDSGGADIAGVQAELSYDPKALTNIKLIPTLDATGFFGTGATVLFNEVKQDTGRISYAVAITQGQGAKKGVGKIATLSFQKIAGSAVAATSVTFLDKTLVTKLGVNESALKEATPLNIVMGQAPAQNLSPTRITFPNTTPAATPAY